MSLTHRTQRPRGAVRLTELTGKRFGTTLAALTLTLALAPTVSPTALADDVTQNDIDQSKTTESSTSTSIADLEAQLSQLNVDLESARIGKVQRAGRHGVIFAGEDASCLNRSSRRGTTRVVNLTVT